MNNLQKQVVNICEKLFSLVVKATVYSKIRYQSTPLDWQNYFKYLSSIYLSTIFIIYLPITYLSIIIYSSIFLAVSNVNEYGDEEGNVFS